MTLSTIVGMPKRRFPPSGFVISPRSTACGIYVLSRINDIIAYLFSARYVHILSIVIPSTPTDPLSITNLLYDALKSDRLKTMYHSVGNIYVIYYLTRKVSNHLMTFSHVAIAILPYRPLQPEK